MIQKLWLAVFRGAFSHCFVLLSLDCTKEFPHCDGTGVVSRLIFLRATPCFCCLESRVAMHSFLFVCLLTIFAFSTRLALFGAKHNRGKESHVYFG